MWMTTIRECRCELIEEQEFAYTGALVPTHAKPVLKSESCSDNV